MPRNSFERQTARRLNIRITCRRSASVQAMQWLHAGATQERVAELAPRSTDDIWRNVVS